MNEITFETHHYGPVVEGVPIVYCFDHDFAKIAAVSTLSLVRSATTVPNIFWVVPSYSFEEVNKAAKEVAAYIVGLTVIKIENNVFDGWRSNNHYTNAMYLRFLIPYLFDEDRALYIDCDTIVLGDLQEIATIDMEGQLIGGVIDPGGHTSAMVFRKGDPYLNSGMLIMDLEGLRKNNFLDECIEIHKQHRFSLTYPDQDIINKFAENKKIVVNPKWNCLVKSHSVIPSEWVEYCSTAKVLHFLGSPKPWMDWCNPIISHYWWSWANSLGVKNIKREHMETVLHYHRFANTLALGGNLVDAYNIEMHLSHMLLNEKADKDTKVTLPFELAVFEHIDKSLNIYADKKRDS